MPRKARIDAPGALQNIIIRGIERNSIFRDDHDKEKFIAVRKLYVSGASIARQLHISPSAVSKAVIRGQKIVRENEL